MANIYEIKTNIFGEDYLEMTTGDGTITIVPMVSGNADYEAYLNPDKVEHLTEIPTPDEA